jgi:hypothetical protein
MTSIPSGGARLSTAARDALDELAGRDDSSIVGLVLTGSVARGMATKLSDVDVMVIRDEAAVGRDVTRSDAIDEIPVSLTELESVRPVGSDGAWQRWAFAWAHVLRDQTGGRVTAAVHRQATLTDDEVHALLIGRSRFDEFLNFAYRAQKSHRDGRPDAARLDSAESVAALLDIVFALAGRVRPYNKYLAWELNEHPLPGDDWPAAELLSLVESMLAGSPTAMTEAFRKIEKDARGRDTRLGATDLGDVIDDWGATELQLLRGVAAKRGTRD